MKVAYTISTANYLFLAKTVGDSFLKHNPEYQFNIFLYDKINDRFDVTYFSPLKIFEIESLHLPSFDEMVIRYSIFEMCNALKPFVAEYILLNNEVETLVYTDSDLMFYDSLKSIDDALHEADIVITPHVYSPMPLDEFRPDEKSFLQGGMYNGGFFALKPSSQTFAFLNWWKSRLEKFCFVNYHEGLFVDQKWMNFIPLYYETAFVLKHPGYNIGHWNLHERILENQNGKYFLNSGQPLVFFHFSGYDIFAVNNISKHQNRFDFKSRSELFELFNDYNKTVLQNSPTEFVKLECFYMVAKQKAEATLKARKQDFIRSSKSNTFKRKVKSKLKSILNINH